MLSASYNLYPPAAKPIRERAVSQYQVDGMINERAKRMFTGTSDPKRLGDGYVRIKQELEVRIKNNIIFFPDTK